MTIQRLLDRINEYSSSVYPSYSYSSRASLPRISPYSIIYSGLIAHYFSEHETVEDRVKLALEYNYADYANDFPGKAHSPLYKQLHLCAFLAQLIFSHTCSASEARPLLKSAFPEVIETIENTEKTISLLDSMSFANPWHDSNIVMALFALRYLITEQDQEDQVLHYTIKLLTKLQCSESGLWKAPKSRHISNYLKVSNSLLNNMAASYHYLPLYKAMNIKPRHLDRLWKSTFRLCTHNYHFCLPAGHSCIDLDALYILAFSSGIEYEHKTKKIFLHYLEGLSSIQNSDGGFSDFPKSNSPQLFCQYLINLFPRLLSHGCLKTFLWDSKNLITRTNPLMSNRSRIISNSDPLCEAYCHESNLFSSFFRILTIDLTQKFLEPKKFSEKNIYRLPFVGF